MLLCFASPSHPWQLVVGSVTVVQDRQGLIRLDRGCAVNPKEGKGISLFSDYVVFS